MYYISPLIQSIGAFVTKSLMTAAYSSLSPDKLQETNYTWSSMGPTLDGHRGVCVLAPVSSVHIIIFDSVLPIV
jgi:tripeptidyl-peptidase-2